MKPSVAAFCLALFLVPLSFSRSQEVSISLSPEIDTLSASLLKNPDNRALQLRLIDAYTLSFNPELALLELLNAEAQGKLIREGAGIKGTVQLSLEQAAAAYSSLTRAYLAAPSDESLFLIAVVEYARGERQRGYWEMTRLKPRVPDLSVKLLSLYERFYLNGRKTIAKAILSALQDVDPVAYGNYFPLPRISILSPASGFATEASQVSVVFEVHHTRPVQTVRVGGIAVFDRGEWKGGAANEGFDQSYTKLVPLQEGRNPVIVQVQDIFGNEARDTVSVNGMNFSRLAAWASPAVDTLRNDLQYLENYIPDSLLIVGQRNAMRALVVAGASSADSGSFFNRGMFLHEFLTNPITGLVPASNSKILVKNRVERQTMKMVLDEWLVKGATFQSMTVVYCAGDWRVTENEWLLRDMQNEWVDIKPYADRLRSLATGGVVIMVDGNIDNRQLLEAGLRSLVQGATISFEAVLLPVGASWIANWSAAALKPSPVLSSGDEFFTTAQIQSAIPGTIVVRAEHPAIPLARNPAASISALAARMVASVSQKLTRERADESVKRKILAFCGDWRRYSEMARYLSNQLSLPDLVVRVDEYQRRARGGGQ